MAIQPTEEERRRIRETVVFWTIIEAWRAIALLAPDPAGALRQAERVVSERFDEALAGSGPDNEVMRHLAADEMAAFWKIVRSPWAILDGEAFADRDQPDPWRARELPDRARYRWRKFRPVR